MIRKHFFAFSFTLAAALAAGPTFKADQTFKGSALTGWKPMGAASWKADKSEIIGTPTDAAGGWLVADKPLQDVGFYASFHCAGGCKTGLLLRAEKTDSGF